MTGQKLAKEKKETAHILFGEDQQHVRNLYAHILQADLGCTVQKPAEFEELANRIAVQIPDGIIMDYNLKWNLKPLNGEIIQNGYDIIKFYQKLNPRIPVCLYSQQELPDFSSIHVIDKAKDYDKVKREFKHFITPVNKIRRFFERYQPKKEKETYESKLNKYRILLKLYDAWLKHGFKKANKPYWSVVFDREIKMFGTPLTVSKDNQKIFNIGVNGKYPTPEKLNYLSQNSKYEPSVFWDTRNDTIIDKQFAAAGPDLQNIPRYLREYFSICMVPSCVKLYLEGDEKKALERAVILEFSSRLEFVKNVFKGIPGKAKREKFKERCAAVKLPVVHSVYKGVIDEISKGPSGNKTAHVILEKVHTKERITEPFEYALLSANEIKHENAVFEYMVHKQLYTASASITPDYEIWNDFLKLRIEDT